MDNTVNDQELDDLLSSTLDDFCRLKTDCESSASTSKEHLNDEKMDIDMKEIDSILEKDPKLKEYWDKLNDSCLKAVNAKNDEEFSASLKETLAALTESSMNIESNLTNEEMDKLWQEMSSGANLEDSDAFLKVVPYLELLLGHLLDKRVLYPAIKELCSKYPIWLETKRDSISKEEYDKYSSQYEFLKKLCKEYEEENDNDDNATKNARFHRIIQLMDKIKNFGAPPKEVAGEVNNLDPTYQKELKSLFEEGMQKNGCSMM